MGQSPGVLCIGVFGLAATVLLASEIPQGIEDREVLWSYPLSVGPYLVLFGLHHVGRSLLTLGFLALIAAHVALVHLSSGTRNPPDHSDIAGFLASRGAVAVGLLLAIASGAGLVWSGFRERPGPARDPSRITLYARTDGDRVTRQVIEEGAVYEVPDAQALKTLLVGVTGGGPYAVEKTAGSVLRVHLPADPHAQAATDLAIEARRPAIKSRPVSPAAPPQAVRPVLTFLLALAMWILANRAIAQTTSERRAAMWVLALGIALVVFNPWVAVGRAEVPLQAGGDRAFWTAVLSTETDVAAWTAWFEAHSVVEAAFWLGGVVFAGEVLFAIGLLLRPEPSSRGVRGIARVTGMLLIGLGLVWLAVGVARIPVVETASELLRAFESDVLPRIPMEVSVLQWGTSAAGPYSVPLEDALALFAAAVVCGAVFLRIAQQPGRGVVPSARAVRIACAAVVGIALVRVALSLGSGPDRIEPPLVSALLAAITPAVFRLHPARPGLGLGVAFTAAAMMVGIP